jgi:hypothetical protein
MIFLPSTIFNLAFAQSIASSSNALDSAGLFCTVNFILIFPALQSDFTLKLINHSRADFCSDLELFSTNNQFHEIVQLRPYVSPEALFQKESYNSRRTSTSDHLTNCVEEGVNLTQLFISIGPGLTEIVCDASIQRESTNLKL